MQRILLRADSLGDVQQFSPPENRRRVGGLLATGSVARPLKRGMPTPVDFIAME